LKLSGARRSGVVIGLLSILLLGACQSKVPAAKTVTPAKPTTTVATNPTTKSNTAPTPVKATLLQGFTSIGTTPLAGAQLSVVDAINNTPLGIVAAGGGNIVASGGGNIVASGGGNLINSKGGFLLLALAGKNIVTDANGTFKIAVAGLKPGRVARIIATLKGKTVTCLVSGDGKAADPKATKKFRLSSTSDIGDLQPLVANTSFSVDVTDQVLLDPAHTMEASALTPALELLGRLDPEARAADCDKLLEEGLQIEDDLQRNIDSNPQLSEQMTTDANPETGALPNDLVKSALTAAGELAAVQADTTEMAKDVAVIETDSTKLATKADAEPAQSDSNLAAVGLDVSAQGQLEENGKAIVMVGNAPTPMPDPTPTDAGTSDQTNVTADAGTTDPNASGAVSTP
jgi:hypothetical protein